ncbi:hypothetical protein SLEP1_g20449 [Rubroshorea leprosula]|uniref:Uncharacterized protein n=1 Tax=Rubroshorea leprosula TaxID=152421 RepID=A0AAV5J8N2_9ROSI|nr:hypothetical protein SLEP1_g20449 [Rubroshorea leprosula]
MEDHGKQKDAVLVRIDAKLNSLSTLHIQKRKIFKVPRELLEINKNAYEPHFVSIGPYHHGNDHFKAMEVYKVRLFKMLLQRIGQLSTATCVAAMRDMVEEARNCYAESLTMSTDDFLEMIVLDGCFVVELFHQIHCREWVEDELFELLGLTSGNDKFLYIKSFFDVFDNSILPGFKAKDASWNEGSIASAKHLLDLLHTRWSSTIQQTGAEQNTATKGGKWSYIPSTSELREAGIEFKKVEGDGRNLIDIKFTNGIFEIPTLTVQNNTECLLRNIIVCEQFDCKFPAYWTDYIILMDCLMNTEKDVDLLCQHAIIGKFLGENAAVATLFNRLGYPVSFSTEMFFYKELSNDINKHYSSPWNKNMAKLRHDYFHSPWSFIFFLAAGFLLLFTLLQTIFTIFPWAKDDDEADPPSKLPVKRRITTEKEAEIEGPSIPKTNIKKVKTVEEKEKAEAGVKNQKDIPVDIDDEDSDNRNSGDTDYNDSDNPGHLRPFSSSEEEDVFFVASDQPSVRSTDVFYNSDWKVMADDSIQNDEVQILIDGRLELLSALQIQKHQIFKVPRELREVNKNTYEPHIVSIGPYHHGKDHLKAMEVHKLLDMGDENKKIEYIKSFFEVFDDSILPGFKVKDENGNEGLIASAKHLLDLVHTRWSSSIGGKGNVTHGEGSITCVEHPLDSVHTNCISPTEQTGANKNIVERGGCLCYIPSASELTEAGVKFKKFEGEGRNLFDIKFTNGILQIPTLIIQNNTECLLRNIIVCEQFDSESQVNYWTDYIVLMDCLINTEKDVELLCQSGIISSFLGDNAAVATLFNRLGYHVSFSQEKFFYKELFGDVKKHHGSFWNRNMAKLRHDYFNSPWSLISFLAAVFLLLLSLVQTTFTIFSRN